MEGAATASWGVRISDADFEKLKAGFQPRDMDDKWRVIATDDADPEGGSLITSTTTSTSTSITGSTMSVHFSRSWTGMVLYVLAVKPPRDRDGGASATIDAITWARDRSGQSQMIHTQEEKAKQQVALLCRGLLGCELDALPQYDWSVFYS